MSEIPSKSDPTLSQEELERVDRVCDRFEDRWRNGQRPALNDFVQDLDSPVGRIMLRELLIVELDYRGQRGEQLPVEEYQALFPNHANLVAAVFGEAMDQRNRSQGTTTPPNSAGLPARAQWNEAAQPLRHKSRPISEVLRGREDYGTRVASSTIHDAGALDSRLRPHLPSHRTAQPLPVS